MKYLLYCTNNLGQIHNSDGSMHDNRKGKFIPKEFESQELAIIEANKFIKANPLLECMIVASNNRNECITIADYDSRADESQKQMLKYKKIKKQKKIKKNIFIIVIMVLLLIFFSSNELGHWGRWMGLLKI